MSGKERVHIMSGVVITTSVCGGQASVRQVKISTTFLDYLAKKFNCVDDEDINNIQTNDGVFGWFDGGNECVVFVWDEYTTITFIPSQS